MAIGAEAGAESRYLVPSVVLIDGGRVQLGAHALQRARLDPARTSDPILSFKTILSATDVTQALSLRAPATVDPTGVFLYRDLLTVYLAFLIELVRQMLAAHQLNAAPDFAWRYTSPIWRSHDVATGAFARIFDEAEHMAREVGSLLTSADGISIAHARRALDVAAAAPSRNLLQREVFEAEAAAFAYARFCPAPAATVLICDIGAGTTDFAGFHIRRSDRQFELEDIPDARQCVALAGDEIDSILIDIAQRKIGPGTRSESIALWRSLKLEARDAKRRLFETGKCQMRGPSKKVAHIRRGELESHPLCRDFKQALGNACRASIGPVLLHALQRNVDRVGLVIAGGGANLPFVPTLLKRAANAANVDVVQFNNAWPGLPPSIGDALPQTAISLGGALATRAVALEAVSS